ncbi:MAG: hypothetical protein K8J31_17310, partial [Anaerolineae bacterium]|nr:hypothetical protein [Anaerolineae bacterium]
FDTLTIYATLKIYNAQSGTQLTAQWEYESSEVYRDSISLSRSASEICVWLSMSQTDVEMRPGSWTVRLFADGTQLESPVAFTIREPDAQMTEGG